MCSSDLTATTEIYTSFPTRRSSDLVTALLIATMAAWRAGLNLPVLVVVVAIAALLAGAYESRNLWDTLVDPLAVLVALGRWAAIALRGMGNAFTRGKS